MLASQLGRCTSMNGMCLVDVSPLPWMGWPLRAALTSWHWCVEDHHLGPTGTSLAPLSSFEFIQHFSMRAFLSWCALPCFSSSPHNQNILCLYFRESCASPLTSCVVKQIWVPCPFHSLWTSIMALLRIFVCGWSGCVWWVRKCTFLLLLFPSCGFTLSCNSHLYIHGLDTYIIPGIFSWELYNWATTEVLLWKSISWKILWYCSWCQDVI